MDGDVGFCGVEQDPGELCAGGGLLNGLDEGPDPPEGRMKLVSEFGVSPVSPELEPLEVVLDKDTEMNKETFYF